jgi:hypothetical protein
MNEKFMILRDVQRIQQILKFSVFITRWHKVSYYLLCTLEEVERDEQGCSLGRKKSKTEKNRSTAVFLFQR